MNGLGIIDMVKRKLDRLTERQTDRVIPNIPPQTLFAEGILKISHAKQRSFVNTRIIS